MQLTQDQKQKVGEWVRAGATLSDIQRRLTDELGLSMTYMDVRFLVIDLGLTVKDKVVKAPVQPVAPAPAAAADEALDEDEGAFGEPPAGPPPLGGAAVSLELDRVTKPGSVVSGTVTFSDGVTAAWALDQFGRLGLSAGKPGYQPSPADLQAFQAELRRALERRGF